MRNIVLVGFMGSGKTTVGKKLAQRLNRAFIDCDDLVEAKAGLAVEEIFRRYGEVHFRTIEKEVIGSLSPRDGLVIAAGGGAVLDPENAAKLRRLGRLVHLWARPEVILRRTGDEHHRPLLENEDREKRIEELLIQRRPFYAGADHEIDTSDLGVEEVVEQIMHYLSEDRHA